MPYLTLLHFEGDPDELLEQKQRHVDPVTSRLAPQLGGLAHVTAKTPTGLLVLNVLADPKDPQDNTMHPEVAQALRESGLPQPRTERYEIARFVLAPAAPEATVP